MDDPTRVHYLVGIVGPCGAGKSTLNRGLQKEGFRCHQIAQEHSYVPYMWKRITNPDVLVFLNASFLVCTHRRQLNWMETDYLEQLHRLEHARQHAHLIVDTDPLTPQGVLTKVMDFLVADVPASK